MGELGLRGADEGAAADLADGEAAPNQLFIGATYGLNAQAQPVGERPVRRQPFAGLDPTGFDRFDDAPDQGKIARPGQCIGFGEPIIHGATMLNFRTIDNHLCSRHRPAMRPPKLDAIDLKILAALQREGRMTKTALAEAVNLSPTPCWERLRRLEQAGIIAGYHARINLEMLTPATIVLVEVTLKRHRHADFVRFEGAVREIPEIVACYATGGGIDYMLKVVTRDVDSYQRLIDRLL